MALAKFRSRRRQARHGEGGGAAVTAVLKWARINEYRADGSPVETVRRALPKRAGGSKHHDAVRGTEEIAHSWCGTRFACVPFYWRRTVPMRTSH